MAIVAPAQREVVTVQIVAVRPDTIIRCGIHHWRKGCRKEQRSSAPEGEFDIGTEIHRNDRAAWKRKHVAYVEVWFQGSVQAHTDFPSHIPNGTCASVLLNVVIVVVERIAHQGFLVDNIETLGLFRQFAAIDGINLDTIDSGSFGMVNHIVDYQWRKKWNHNEKQFVGRKVRRHLLQVEHNGHIDGTCIVLFDHTVHLGLHREVHIKVALGLPELPYPLVQVDPFVVAVGGGDILKALVAEIDRAYAILGGGTADVGIEGLLVAIGLHNIQLAVLPVDNIICRAIDQLVFMAADGVRFFHLRRFQVVIQVCCERLVLHQQVREGITV